jgi:hypothetical protein
MNEYFGVLTWMSLVRFDMMATSSELSLSVKLVLVASLTVSSAVMIMADWSVVD